MTIELIRLERFRGYSYFYFFYYACNFSFFLLEFTFNQLQGLKEFNLARSLLGWAEWLGRLPIYRHPKSPLQRTPPTSVPTKWAWLIWIQLHGIFLPKEDDFRIQLHSNVNLKEYSCGTLFLKNPREDKLLVC
jgi:hypothetical protein